MLERRGREACWGPPPESSSAAIGEGETGGEKDTCKPTEVEVC